MDIEKERNMMYKIQRKENPDKKKPKKKLNQIFSLNEQAKQKKKKVKKAKTKY